MMTWLNTRILDEHFNVMSETYREYNMYENEMMAKDRASAEIGLARKISFREQIENGLKYHIEQVDKQRKLLALLDANPAIAEFMELTRS